MKEKYGCSKWQLLFLPGGGWTTLLRLEQVQEELKLSEEQRAKVSQVGEKLREEMREQYSALPRIESPQKRWAKMTELRDQFNWKGRDQLRGVLDRDQIRRLSEMQMQIWPATESLAAREVVARLELTQEQQNELAQIRKDVHAKQRELLSGMRESTEERWTKVIQKLLAVHKDADAKALRVLTDKQKENFEEMKGKSFVFSGTQYLY